MIFRTSPTQYRKRQERSVIMLCSRYVKLLLSITSLPNKQSSLSSSSSSPDGWKSPAPIDAPPSSRATLAPPAACQRQIKDNNNTSDL